MAKATKTNQIKLGDGDEPVVVLPLRQYEDLIEDLEMLRSVELPKRIKKARQEVAEGKYYTHEEVKQELGLD